MEWTEKPQTNKQNAKDKKTPSKPVQMTKMLF